LFKTSAPKITAIMKKNSYTSLTLFGIYISLIALGLVNLYSACAGGYYFHTQLKHCVVSFVCFFIVARIVPYNFIRTSIYPIFSLSIISLVMVLLNGHRAGGSTRWINIAGFNLQPSEFVKIALVFFVAQFLYSKRSKRVFRFSDLWLLLVGIFFTFFLIFKQPDLGTAGLCLIISFVQLSFIRINISKNTIIKIISLLLIVLVLSWNYGLHSYQKLRILNLLKPEMDPSGSGYSSIQSLIAIGSGGVWGKGFQLGTQNQLHFLPARHTDFILSVFAEEHGIIGCLFVCFLFYKICSLGLSIAQESPDIFKTISAIGITTLIFFQFAINLLMILGLFPVVGMALPFFSYGGSSLLSSSFAIAYLIAIDRNNKETT
jgi:rod shape determining protein RodA